MSGRDWCDGRRVRLDGRTAECWRGRGDEPQQTPAVRQRPGWRGGLPVLQWLRLLNGRLGQQGVQELIQRPHVPGEPGLHRRRDAPRARGPAQVEVRGVQGDGGPVGLRALAEGIAKPQHAAEKMPRDAVSGAPRRTSTPSSGTPQIIVFVMNVSRGGSYGVALVRHRSWYGSSLPPACSRR